MKVEQANSKYQESPEAADMFSVPELKKLRALLRRLRYLDGQIHREPASISGGLMFAEREVDALAFVLDEVGYLADIPE